VGVGEFVSSEESGWSRERERGESERQTSAGPPTDPRRQIAGVLTGVCRMEILPFASLEKEGVQTHLSI